MSQNTLPPASSSWTTFERTTSRWGRITMIAAIVLTLAGPGLLAVSLGVDPLDVLGAVLAIATTFGIIWFVEPITYFPILGPASMYQAFMIGNISNKLLPAAIVAQSAIGARPDTKRGQLAAVLAICGAAATHIVALIVLVGVFGTLLLEVVPPEITATVQAYVLPAILGAVVVQLIANNLRPRILIIALAVGAVLVFALTPLAPALAPVAPVGAVILTVLIALLLPAAPRPSADGPDATDDGEDLS